MTTLTAHSPAATVERIAPLIRAHAAEAERKRRLAAPVVEALRDAGLFRMFVPRQLGGLELGAVEGFEILERVSQLDSAAGWNLQIAATGTTIGALYPDAGAREVFGSADSIMAGGFNPPGAAIPVDGGYRLNGRWPFASGCQHATWLLGTALQMRDGQPEMLPDGSPIMLALLFRAGEGRVIESWDPLGMRGTGSHEIVADDVFVPAERAAALRPFEDLGPAFQGPLYKLGTIPPLMGNAVVALGIARAAIDEAVEVAKTRVPAFMQPRPVDRGVVHAHLARAEATLGAARTYFYCALDEAWQAACSGRRPDTAERLKAQLAASHAG